LARVKAAVEFARRLAAAGYHTRALAITGIEPGMGDAICGDSPRTVADEYETPTLRT
jgi:hypothetical protein